MIPPFLTRRSFQAYCLMDPWRFIHIRFAVLLVLPSPGQADIFPFFKNLSQEASDRPRTLPHRPFAPACSQSYNHFGFVCFLHQNKRQKIRAALNGNVVAGAIMAFFALCGVWTLHYLTILLTAFRLARGITLLLVALDMLVNKRQARREQGNDTLLTDDNIAIFPLANPLLAGPAAITAKPIGVTSGMIGEQGYF